MDFLSGFLMQIISSAGVIFLFGWLIALLRRGFCRVAGRCGPTVLLLTGIVGTPIHELSHAIMCLLFGHKITDVKLYDPKARDGALGYVSHTYNKKNVYHQIGNFFIGVAPVVLGGGVIILLLSLLLPDVFEVISLEIEILSAHDIGSLPIADFFAYLWSSASAIFAADNFSYWQGFVFIILAVMISTHMEMSGSDIKSGLGGFAFLLVITLLLDGALYVASPTAFYALTASIASFGLALAAILSISAFFLLMLLTVAALIRGIGMIFSR